MDATTQGDPAFAKEVLNSAFAAVTAWWCGDRADQDVPNLVGHVDAVTHQLDGDDTYHVHVAAEGDYDQMHVEVPIEGRVVCVAEITDWGQFNCGACQALLTAHISVPIHR